MAAVDGLADLGAPHLARDGAEHTLAVCAATHDEEGLLEAGFASDAVAAPAPVEVEHALGLAGVALLGEEGLHEPGDLGRVHVGLVLLRHALGDEHVRGRGTSELPGPEVDDAVLEADDVGVRVVDEGGLEVPDEVVEDVLDVLDALAVHVDDLHCGNTSVRYRGAIEAL